MHRLGFVWKRPKRRLLTADPAKRAAFVTHYRNLVADAAARGARIFFVDEAHFRADGDLRGLWTPRGQPALVDSSSLNYGAKASYYSGEPIREFLKTPGPDLRLVALSMQI